MLLLRMKTGSHLYGLNQENSDEDFVEIYDKCNSYHKVTPDGDITRWSLSKFMALSDKGAHNALEIMFAPAGWPMVDLLWPLRVSYRANPYLVATRFSKAAENYLSHGTLKGDTRAAMLIDWIEETFHTARFNPRWGLTQEPKDVRLF